MTVLILAGTGEARMLCERLAGGNVLASLAGVTRRPKHLGVPTRIGGFGGGEGFVAMLTAQAITGVLDATHPYAQMPARTVRLCADHSVPYLRVLRPPWHAQRGDDWLEINDFAHASHVLPEEATVFVATGGQSLQGLSPLHGRTLWLRRVDESGPAPWPKGGVIHGLPSHDSAAEQALLSDLGITHIIAKNSGGPMGYAKLEAARALNIPVLLLRRPVTPVAPHTESLDHAEQWARDHGA